MDNKTTNITVSVITVCYNAAADLPMTIESILSQNYSDYEYIIKDGGSTDSSAAIINSYIPRFEEKGIKVKYVSKPDKGIYDAMNCAVSMAEGTWINFMNAGDCFYSSDVLANIFSEKTYPTSAVLYGDCAEYEYDRFYLFPKNIDEITSSMPFSHQAMFTHHKLLERHPFKTEYRYSADYDFILTCNDMQLHFTDVGCIICITNKDGVSSVNYHDMLNESAAILQSHGITPTSQGNAKRTQKILSVKQYVLDHFPKFVLKTIRGIQIKKRHQDFECIIPPWHPAYTAK